MIFIAGFKLTCLIANFATVTWYTVKAADRLPTTDSLPGPWKAAGTAHRHRHLRNTEMIMAFSSTLLKWMCLLFDKSIDREKVYFVNCLKYLSSKMPTFVGCSSKNIWICCHHFLFYSQVSSWQLLIWLLIPNIGDSLMVERLSYNLHTEEWVTVHKLMKNVKIQFVLPTWLTSTSTYRTSTVGIWWR